MKRVTFLVALFKDGGTETVLVRYLRALDAGRWQVRLLIGIEYPGLEVFLPDLPPSVQVDYLLRECWYTRIGRKKLRHKLNVFEKAAEVVVCTPIKRLLKRRRLAQLCNDQDLVVDFDGDCRSLLGGVVVPKMAFFHLSIGRSCAGRPRRIAYLERRFHTYSRIVLLCEAMADEGRRLWPSLADRFEVLYNPMDMADLRARASQEAEPEPQTPFIVELARLHERQKDTATLLRAYRRALSLADGQGRQLPPLLVLGCGADEADLKELASDLGLEQHVAWLGFKANPQPWLRQAALLVLSSKFEGLPTVLIEAQVHGTVCLATDCPTGPRDILLDGRAGMLVPVGDPDAMAQGMVRCLFDEGLRQRYQAAMRESVERFDVRNIVPKFERLMLDVMDEAGRH